MVDDFTVAAPDYRHSTTCNLHESLDLYQLNVLLNITTNKITFNFTPNAPFVKEYIEEYIEQSSKNSDYFIVARDKCSILSQITNITRSLSNFISRKMENSTANKNSVPFIVNKYFEDIANNNNQNFNMNEEKMLKKQKRKKLRKKIDKHSTTSQSTFTSIPAQRDRKKSKSKHKDELNTQPSDLLLQKKAMFQKQASPTSATSPVSNYCGFECELSERLNLNHRETNKGKPAVSDNQVYFVVLSHNTKKDRIGNMQQGVAQDPVVKLVQHNSSNKQENVCNNANSIKENIPQKDVTDISSNVEDRIKHAIKEAEANNLLNPGFHSVPRQPRFSKNFHHRDYSTLNVNKQHKTKGNVRFKKNVKDHDIDYMEMFYPSTPQAKNSNHKSVCSKGKSGKSVKGQPTSSFPRKELSFTQLNLAPVMGLYNCMRSNDQHSLLKGELSPIPEHRDKPERHKKKNRNKSNDKKSSISELITKREKVRVKNSFRNFIDNVNRKRLHHGKKKVVSTDRLIEISTKAIDEDGTTKIGFTVEGIEPPKRILMRDKSETSNSTTKKISEEKVKKLHMTFFPIIQILESNPYEDIRNSDTQTNEATDSQFFTSEYSAFAKKQDNECDKRNDTCTSLDTEFKDQIEIVNQDLSIKSEIQTSHFKNPYTNEKDFMEQLTSHFENVQEKILDVINNKIHKPNVKYKVPKKRVRKPKETKSKAVDILYDGKQKYVKDVKKSEEKLPKEKLTNKCVVKLKNKSDEKLAKSNERLTKKSNEKLTKKSNEKIAKKSNEKLTKSDEKLAKNAEKQEEAKPKKSSTKCTSKASKIPLLKPRKVVDNDTESVASKTQSIEKKQRHYCDLSKPKGASTNTKPGEVKRKVEPPKMTTKKEKTQEIDDKKTPSKTTTCKSDASRNAVKRSPRTQYYLKRFLESLGEDEGVESSKLKIAIEEILQQDYKVGDFKMFSFLQKNKTIGASKSSSSSNINSTRKGNFSLTSLSADNLFANDKESSVGSRQHSGTFSFSSKKEFYHKCCKINQNERHFNYVVRKPGFGSELISLQVPRKFGCSPFRSGYQRLPDDKVETNEQRHYDPKTLDYMGYNEPGMSSYGDIACFFCKKLMCGCQKEHLPGDEDEKYNSDGSSSSKVNKKKKKPKGVAEMKKSYPVMPTIIKTDKKKAEKAKKTDVKMCLVDQINPFDKRNNVYQTYVVLTDQTHSKLVCSAPQSRTAICRHPSTESDIPKSTSLTSLGKDDLKKVKKHSSSSSSDNGREYKKRRFKTRKRNNVKPKVEVKPNVTRTDNDKSEPLKCDAECQSVCDVGCQSTNTILSSIVPSKKLYPSMVTLASWKPTKNSLLSSEKNSMDFIEQPFFLHRRPKMLENLGITSKPSLKSEDNYKQDPDISTDSLNSLKQTRSNILPQESNIERKFTSFRTLCEHPITNFLVYNNTIETNNPFCVKPKKRPVRNFPSTSTTSRRTSQSEESGYESMTKNKSMNDKKKPLLVEFFHRHKRDQNWPKGTTNNSEKEQRFGQFKNEKQLNVIDPALRNRMEELTKPLTDFCDLNITSKKHYDTKSCPSKNNLSNMQSSKKHYDTRSCSSKSNLSYMKTSKKQFDTKSCSSKSNLSYVQKSQKDYDTKSCPSKSKISFVQTFYMAKKKANSIKYQSQNTNSIGNSSPEGSVTSFRKLTTEKCKNKDCNVINYVSKSQPEKKLTTFAECTQMNSFAECTQMNSFAECTQMTSFAECTPKKQLSTIYDNNDASTSVNYFTVDQNIEVNFSQPSFCKSTTNTERRSLLNEVTNLKVFSNLSIGNSFASEQDMVSRTAHDMFSRVLSDDDSFISPENARQSLSRFTVYQPNKKQQKSKYGEYGVGAHEDMSETELEDKEEKVEEVKEGTKAADKESKLKPIFVSPSVQKKKRIDRLYENVNFQDSDTALTMGSYLSNFFPNKYRLDQNRKSAFKSFTSRNKSFTRTPNKPGHYPVIVPHDPAGFEYDDFVLRDIEAFYSREHGAKPESDDSPEPTASETDQLNGHICKCPTHPGIRKYEQQIEDCKAYYEKIRMEEEAKNKGYWRQYTEFTEIPLSILLGKKIKSKKQEFAESADQTSRPVVTPTTDQTVQIVPESVGVGQEGKDGKGDQVAGETKEKRGSVKSEGGAIDKTEEQRKSIDSSRMPSSETTVGVLEQPKIEEELSSMLSNTDSKVRVVLFDILSDVFKQTTENEKAREKELKFAEEDEVMEVPAEGETTSSIEEKSKAVADEDDEPTGESDYYKDKVFVQCILDDVIEHVFLSQVTESETDVVDIDEKATLYPDSEENRKKKFNEARQSLTDKEVFDKLLDNFDKEEDVARRLSSDKDFFGDQLSQVKSKKSTEVILQKMPTLEEEFDHKKIPLDRLGEDVKLDNGLFEVVDPAEIGLCFTRGFRTDNISLSGDACFAVNKQDKVKASKLNLETESIIDFSERDSPLDFLLALGFMVDEATNALKDEDVEHRLLAAITEARVWINQITTTQGTLLYLVALKAKPRTMRYFLQLVEAIINKRITNAVKLDGFLRTLERIEDGEIGMINIFGLTQFENEDNEEKVVKNQLREVFISVFKVAEKEANKRGNTLSVEALILLRILAARYRAGLHPHLELIASYIGKGLLVTDIQLEAAMIFLSRLDTVDVKIKEFEKYCGIGIISEKYSKKDPQSKERKASPSKAPPTSAPVAPASAPATTPAAAGKNTKAQRKIELKKDVKSKK